VEVFYGGDQLEGKLVDSDLARRHLVEVPPETGAELLQVNRRLSLEQADTEQLWASFTFLLLELLVDLHLSIVQSFGPVLLYH